MKSWTGTEPLLPPGGSSKPPIDKRRLLIASLAAIVICGPTLFWGEHPSFTRYLLNNRHGWNNVESRPFLWDELDANETLEFHPCYDGFECAKLALPLDYFNSTHPNSTIGLALAKLPARVPVDDPRYGGPILINPGGPGGSGVMLALMAAQQLQLIVDSGDDPKLSSGPNSKSATSAKYFDIIGFDPRGIGATEPQASCMPDGASWWSWQLRVESEGILDSSDAALGRLWSMNHAYGASCEQAMDGENGPDIKRYMTTASVARDMLEVVEKHSSYVTKRIVQLPKQSNENLLSRSDSEMAKTPKLQYWGFSYGTYLGSTFASMFPDRVGRLVLDGVVNSDDYNAGLGNGSLRDNEKVMESFYTYCLLSGPESCCLATSASSVEDIKARVHGIIQSLYHNPLPLNSTSGPEVLTYSDLKGILFSSLYQPALTFDSVAKFLVEIEARGGPILEQVAEAFQQGHIYHCPIDGSILQPDVPQWAILCSDGEDMRNENITSFKKYWDLLDSISYTSGSIWSILRLRCNSWKIRAVHRYQGVFGGNTSHPILWISNTADPVTPLKSGRIMNSRFPGSVQLVQDSAGHCSISTPTPCTLNYVRNYFQEGKLPAPGTVCIPPTSPFSLNSTDPDSPFYEPSIGHEAVKAHYEGNLMWQDFGLETMHAAKHVQTSLAEKFTFWPTHNHERVRAVFNTAAMVVAKQNGLEEIEEE